MESFSEFQPIVIFTVSKMLQNQNKQHLRKNLFTFAKI
jgi:hypothetical protein